MTSTSGSIQRPRTQTFHIEFKDLYLLFIIIRPVLVRPIRLIYTSHLKYYLYRYNTTVKYHKEINKQTNKHLQ